MKSISQIKEYLSNVTWLTKFKRNVYLKNKTGDIGIQYLIKTYPREFINEAFMWYRTKEGERYWFDIYTEYLEWFDGN